MGGEHLASRGSCKFGMGSDLIPVSEIQESVRSWTELAKVVPIPEEEGHFIEFRSISGCKGWSLHWQCTPPEVYLKAGLHI